MKPCKYCGCEYFEERIKFSGRSTILHDLNGDTEFSLDSLEKDLKITRSSDFLYCHDCGKRGERMIAKDE